MKNIKLSILISSRNDAYNGDSLERLKKSLLHNVELLRNKPAEIIVTDWGSEQPLSEMLDEELYPREIVKFNYISPRITRRIPSVFPEVLCLNSGARESKGDYIGRLDQDTIIGKNFIEWFFSDKPNEESFYFSTRRDMEQNQFSTSPDEVGHNPCDRLNINSFWKCAVGVLLIPKKIWYDIGGYDEKNMWINHMEHEFIVRLNKVCKFVNLGPQIDFDFYHIYHERHTMAGRKSNNFVGLELSSGIETRPNGVNWGFFKLKK